MDSSEEKVKVDVVVVGAGPAGLMATHRLAQEGLEVIVVERGSYAGSKNVSGLLYSSVLSEAIPDFSEKAPLERPVTRRTLGFLGDDVFGALEFGCQDWRQPPHNQTWVVYRAQFDRWLAQEVEDAGANLLDGMVVDDLLYEGEGNDKRVVGVQIRGDEPFYANVVILAEGALGVVTEKAISELGMRHGLKHQYYGIGVKEIWGLPSGVIEDRFHLEPGEGAALEWVGSPFKGLVGGGFLYTGKESLALGFIVKVDSLAQSGLSPHELMESFKSHPEVKKYIHGGELLEYSAHTIPEGGYDSIPQLSDHGLLITGDAGGLVNASVYHEGANLAMASGRIAAEAVIQAHSKGDFSRDALAFYDEMLKDSFVMRDLEQYRKVPEAQKVFPRLMEVLPPRFCRILVDAYGQSQDPKRSIQRTAIRNFFDGLPKFRTAVDLWHMRRLIR
jgi:electron transfer flavoprotein-quinone oxidoreductase